MEKWNGKTAIVTGASAGIGDATVRDLVKYGINVVALARRLERLETLKEELKDEPGKVIPVTCDVTDKASIDAAFKEIEEKVGSIHILVNSAGMALMHGMFAEGEEELDEIISSTINTNFLGLVRVARKGYQLIKKSEDYGIIINIGSVLGYNQSVAHPANVYPATKAAVRAVTESMRQELLKYEDPKIRVCEVSPGAVKTELGGGFKNQPQIKALVESGKMHMLRSSDVSQAVLFMLMTPYDVNMTEIVLKRLGAAI
ncbi:farnesol dehydrogenase-like [Chironomus tepperi]|uniref:farnesol dehydrogenase-like n=1 Tax=Chironomus tepperi TaxID=113505 RepID=UPI00391F33B9